jgi:hypothetical protein
MPFIVDVLYPSFELDIEVEEYDDEPTLLAVEFAKEGSPITHIGFDWHHIGSDVSLNPVSNIVSLNWDS